MASSDQYAERFLREGLGADDGDLGEFTKRIDVLLEEDFGLPLLELMVEFETFLNVKMGKKQKKAEKKMVRDRVAPPIGPYTARRCAARPRLARCLRKRGGTRARAIGQLTRTPQRAEVEERDARIAALEAELAAKPTPAAVPAAPANQGEVEALRAKLDERTRELTSEREMTAGRVQQLQTELLDLHTKADRVVALEAQLAALEASAMHERSLDGSQDRSGASSTDEYRLRLAALEDVVAAKDAELRRALALLTQRLALTWPTLASGSSRCVTRSARWPRRQGT